MDQDTDWMDTQTHTSIESLVGIGGGGVPIVVSQNEMGGDFLRAEWQNWKWQNKPVRLSLSCLYFILAPDRRMIGHSLFFELADRTTHKNMLFTLFTHTHTCTHTAPLWTPLLLTLIPRFQLLTLPCVSDHLSDCLLHTDTLYNHLQQTKSSKVPTLITRWICIWSGTSEMMTTQLWSSLKLKA